MTVTYPGDTQRYNQGTVNQNNMELASSAQADDEDLFREIILDHYRYPHHHRAMDEADPGVITAHNPTCGDDLRLCASMAPDGSVSAIEFDGAGCSISQASASIMCDQMAGKSVSECHNIAKNVKAFLMGQDAAVPDGDIEALGGVRKYPARTKCATLAWNGLLELLSVPPFSSKEEESG